MVVRIGFAANGHILLLIAHPRIAESPVDPGAALAWILGSMTKGLLGETANES